MITTADMLLRLVVAAVLGSVIGLERERLSWSAGLRTHMLVSVGSALIMIVSAYGFNDVLARDHVALDPSRIAAQVVSGIGFLGAGAILLRGKVVRGLTTAASVWAVAAVGLASGGGLYAAAISATVLMLLILAGIKPFEERYRAKRQTHDFTLLFEPGHGSVEAVSSTLRGSNARVRQYVAQRNETGDIEEVRVRVAPVSERDIEAILERMRALPGVREVE